ncbi:MAG TPA: DUF1206 domain-containing protein [Pseudolysinimonas sp.]|jgi:hypothetical protein
MGRKSTARKGTAERDTKRFALLAEDDPAFQLIARAGYAVSGLLHALIGVIALTTVFGVERGRADQTGALVKIAEIPAGAVLIWAMVVAVVALGLWQIARGIAVSEKDDRRRWFRRISAFGQAFGFLAIGFLAARIAIAGKSGAGDSRTLTAAVLAVPGGAVLIGAVGVAVFGAGVYFVVKGISRRFLRDLGKEGVGVRRSVELLGVTGHVAKGVALAILGVLVVVAAVTSDPQQAAGLDQVFDAIAALPFGAALIAIVGVGFIAYGGYCGFRARLARL